MKLRSLSLGDLKKFTTPIGLEGIADGLNVVAGPNEMGKSTLLDALRAVLFEKHSSKAQPIVALQNDRNDAGPVVALAFELGDGLYRITKRFIRKPYARLCCPDGRTLEGDAAEDWLRGLLGFDEPGKTGAKPETLGMWNVLWVRQGQSFGAPDLPASAQSSLHNALESEVGDVLGGRRGRLLPQRIKSQLDALVTSGGKPRGDYRLLPERLQTLQNNLTELDRRRQELSQTLDDLEEAEKLLARLSSGDRDRADQIELDEARVRRGEVAALEERIQAAATELRLKEQKLVQAEQAVEGRRKLSEEIAFDEAAAMAARERLTEVAGQEKKARSKRDSLRAAVGVAEASVTEADALVARSRAILAAVERHARLQALQQQCKKAEEAEERQHQANQAAAAILVTDKAIEQIRTAAKGLETIVARLRAAATTIRFEMPPEGIAGIEIDGQKLSPASPTLQAVQPIAISIPDRGRIIVDPAIKDRDKLIAQQRDARAKLAAWLDQARAADVEDAERQHARRRGHLEEAELARQEAAVHAPGTDEYEAGAQALADYIEGLSQIHAREKDELGLRELPRPQEARATLRTVEEHAGQARHALATARAELAGPEEALAQMQTELGAVTARSQDADQLLKQRREQYEKAEESCPNTRLEAELEAARSEQMEQAAKVSALAAERVGETLPQLDARIERLENALRERREKRHRLEVKIAELKSRIDASEGAGIDEAIEQKHRELERCKRECRLFDREVEVLTLLYTTLAAAEREAKERYLSPVLKRVRPYLQALLPGANITIDEDLQITGIVREAGYEEAFSHLSMGTQEQIAVLVRLAFAEMLAEQGRPATIILDDALVFSDDRRISCMFDILSMAARKVQVLIFTCREQLFEGLGGRELSLVPARSDELTSA